MSGWTFEAKVDTTLLTAMQARLSNIPQMLYEVADETKDRVVQNIEAKNIIDTGALRDSITAEQDGDGALVRDGVPYGIYNEFGTRRGMIARPFFIPAIELAGKIVEQKFTELFR